MIRTVLYLGLWSLLFAFGTSTAAVADDTSARQPSKTASTEATPTLRAMLKSASPEPSKEGSLAIGSNVTSFETLATRAAKGLIYCIGAFLIAVSFYRRFYAPNESQASHNPIAIIAKKNIGGRMNVLLLEVDGERILLSQTSEEVSLLTKLEPEMHFGEVLNDRLPAQQDEPQRASINA